MQIIVVYKVDRLTRALADFAKLVELFDAHGVSFVSVTQQFNTTSSMGRLTLNVLLSFAQFEREVIGERIRDKIAASKRKGLWMGGVVSFGYSPKGRTLVIKEGQASQVQEIYRLYVQTGCVRRTKEELDRRGWKIVHKGQLFQGQHQPIIDSSLWQAVQARLAANLQGHRTQRTAAAPSLLAGIVVDAMGNRLMPSHATKGARRYRYYVGPGRSNGAGSVLRIPAQELEQLVLKAVASLLVDQTKVMASIAAVDAATAHRVLIEAKTLAERLTEGRFEAPIRIDTSRRLVEFVSVRNDEIQIAVRMDAVVGLEVDKARSEPVPINVPVYLKRCGLGVRLIVPGRSGHPDRSPDAKLVALCVVVTTGSIDLHPDAETAWPRSLEKRRSPGRT